ncbi:hypothetical protein CSB69_2741 [Morganella morganii]|nr:hypothetical protein CSB69_2741 [Morganella morganii]EMP53206.1 hypothetical protein C790_03182 [Morganella morganii SC01]
MNSKYNVINGCGVMMYNKYKYTDINLMEECKISMKTEC